ncbi:MAG TPA: DUF983 domain-containing protein [Verrucomicrobiota bacterium]|nr:DUF983 domain-containing protein [Verrucomicrobiota bacterium]HNT14416.1 DUF983 domain-containing protein [Verrucomicrobiota bacterium]
MNSPIPKLGTVLWRGLRRRCPRCGQGAIYRSFLRMHDHCAVCGLKFMHDQGDLWVYIIIVDRALFILPLIAMLYFRLYNPYTVWFALFIGLLVGGMFYTVPHRNSICLGLDHWAHRKWGRNDSDRTPAAPPES